MFDHSGWTGSRWLGVTVPVMAFVLALSTATPKDVSSAIQQNEASAIATLRELTAVEEQFKADVSIDTNCDGIGEYGYFAELAGVLPMRVPVGNPCQPGAGTVGLNELDPQLLRSSFGDLNYGVRGGITAHRGYYFQMWLPGWANPHWGVDGVPEDVSGGKLAAPFPDPSTGAAMWCCYAWPMEFGRTGRKAFFVNERGVVLEDQNRDHAPYSGKLSMPFFFSAYTVIRDMSSSLRVGVPGRDGTIWLPVH